MKVPLCKKTQTPMVFLDEAERGIHYAFRRNKIPTQLRSALRNHSVSSDGYNFQDLQQKYFAGLNDDRYAIDVGIALDLALTELIQLKKMAKVKFSETFDAVFRHRVSKPLMHRPIVRTLLKEAGASGEEADALAAEVFEACHEETKRTMLKQRNGIVDTNLEGVDAELALEMGVLSKGIFAKCASEIVPGICLNDTASENNRDENNEIIPSNSNINDTITNEHTSPIQLDGGENSSISSPLSMATVAAAPASSASIEVVLSLDAITDAWNKTEAFIDKTLASRAETNFIGDDVVDTSRSSSTSSSSKTFALFKAQPADPQKRRDANELFERAENSAARCRTPCAQLERSLAALLAAPLPPPLLQGHPLLLRRQRQILLRRKRQNRVVHVSRATCAFERAVQAHRAALGLGLRDDDSTGNSSSSSSSSSRSSSSASCGSFWF